MQISPRTRSCSCSVPEVYNMAANYKIKLGTDYLYGSLLPSAGNHIEFDKPVKRLRAPGGVGLCYDVDGTDTLFDYIAEGGEIEFANKGGYPISMDILTPNSETQATLGVVEYGDVANPDYFKPEEA